MARPESPIAWQLTPDARFDVGPDRSYAALFVGMGVLRKVLADTYRVHIRNTTPEQTPEVPDSNWYWQLATATELDDSGRLHMLGGVPAVKDVYRGGVEEALSPAGLAHALNLPLGEVVRFRQFYLDNFHPVPNHVPDGQLWIP